VNTPRSGRAALRLGVATLLAVAALGFHVFFVVPRWIEVTHHSIVGQVSQALRIAHLGDLQARGFGLHEREIVRLVQRARPDLIVVTGDVVDGDSLEPARELLRRLHAPLGVWVVGSDRHARVHADDQRAFYGSVGARFLENEGILLREDVFIVGVAEEPGARTDRGTPFGAAPAASFKLALFHSPDRFAELAGLFDLGLASDTHGGPMPMPSSPPDGRRYTQGWYTTNRSNLYVSRGLGTEPIPARLLSRPEIALIEIRPSR
jgi:predicted MPP superfamily phosphohydrolase